jgi:hypothetical protein
MTGEACSERAECSALGRVCLGAVEMPPGLVHRPLQPTAARGATGKREANTGVAKRLQMVVRSSATIVGGW